MTELLSELRRSPVAGDRAVAELLGSLRPAEDRRPRASEALAAFIAERGSGVTPRAELQVPAGQSSLLVVLGGAADPKPARRRVMTGAWANMALAAAIVLAAVAVATAGPSREVVVRPTDSSSTVAPATTAPADQADPTPRRHHSVATSAGPRPHRVRSHPAATSSVLAPSMSTHAAAGRDEESAHASGDAAQPEESGDDRGDETARGTDDGGDTSGDGGGDGGETPDGVDD